MKRKYLIVVSIVVIVFLSVRYFITSFSLLQNKIDNDIKTLRKQRMEIIIKKESIGVIDEIDNRQATIYYIIDGEKYSFSKVGRFEIYYYAVVGDSIIKQANSKLIKVKKQDGSEKEFMLE